MKTRALLLGVRQVKTCAGANVVNLPDLPVVLPVHAGTEERFKVNLKPDDRATEKL